MDIQFVPGQRWVSNTESELGLGIVMDTANRRVTVSFPAGGERRTYAMDNAPLSRVHYTVGETISSADGISFTIAEIHEQGGYLIYAGQDCNGNSISLEEIDLESFVQFSRPQDRLFAGQIDKNSSFQLRVETLHHLRRLQQAPTYGLLGPRVQLLPHQLYIAYQVARRHAPRVLLADEVGLGKTIEAGLILHQQFLTGAASRALIVVPDSLVHQWLVEMSRRFNLQFTILDEERCEALETAEHGNPFESAQCVLCALSLLTNNQTRHTQALSADWDLLIVDEAHHLSWTETEVSPAYACIEALASKIPGLLLLTATPEQLGIDGHFARLRLLDPDRYYDLQKFRLEEESYQAINTLVQKLLADDVEKQLRNDKNLLKELANYISSDALHEFEKLLEENDARHAIDELIQNILDRHGTGRVLFRNTRDVVEGFPQRQLHTYSLEVPSQYADIAGKEVPQTVDEKELIQLLCPEVLLGESWLEVDPRVKWFATWLLEHRDEKVLVICALASTAKSLEEYLRIQHGIRSAVFHEGLDLIARDRAAAYFADDEDGAQVLICSEIGSEGSNFQFSHHLVLFDLPLNPDLLEQRIGRLDRIGQIHTVQIHIPHYAAGAQQELLRWYDEGLNAFKQVCSIGQSIYQIFSQRLHQCMLKQQDDENFESLIEDTHNKAQDMLQVLQQGRDRLLELNSCNPKKAAEVVDGILDATHQLELADYMERVCDEFGVDQQYHSAHSVILQPGDHMHGHSFPGLPEGGLTATYDRSKALVREDMQFHSWEHPMVTGSMDLILSGEFGNAVLCTIKLQSLKPGTLLLEGIFTIHCAAPKKLQIHRYFPQVVIRVVVNQNKNDLTKVFAIEHMNHLAERVKNAVGQNIVRHARKQITELVKYADSIAAIEKEKVIGTALQKMQAMQSSECERLIALSKVNPNIRKEEIDYLKSATTQMQDSIQQAQLKFDAIRIAVARQ